MAKEPTESRRKLVEFDAQTWHALDLFQGLPMRHSEISCTSMHGHRFEGGAAGERERFRKTASEGQPIGLAFYPNASFQSTKYP